MLDPNALSQLNQLKAGILADKDIQQGTVRGTQSRFGFVVLDDGREAFLPPDAMSRVFPGDRVEASLTQNENNKDKWDAELISLLESPLKVVFGRYLIRGKGFFVATDMPQLNRWLFIPPKARANAEEGDFLECLVTRHPFEDGKAQVKIVDILGKDTDIGIEHKVTQRKHQLPNTWNQAASEQLDGIEIKDIDAAGREDLTALPLVTIDSASTQDMDDAVHAEANDQGWTLSVAIADPSSDIEQGSPLDLAALERANTTYLAGGPVTMLPEALAHGRYSLVAGETRQALVCQMQITSTGHISEYRFCEALITSRHKLSYEQVADLLENDNSAAVPSDTIEHLNALDACANALNAYRAEHMLLMEDRSDFELQLNEQMRINNIVCQKRNRAQQLVEESMLATNRSAGDLFAQHASNNNLEQCLGIFSSHAGFRAERTEAIKQLLGKDLPALAELEIETLDGYRHLIQSLQKDDSAAAQNQLAACRLMLQAGKLTHEAKPHMGLGMQYYATVTSPIRRYNDLFNHRAIKAILANQPLTGLSDKELAGLQERIGRTRRAARDLEQWLTCLYMQEQELQDKLAGKPQPLEATVSRVTSGGIAINLIENGVSGFIRLNSKEYKFDAERMTLTSETQTLKLNQPVTVVLDGSNLDKKQINFKQQLRAA